MKSILIIFFITLSLFSCTKELSIEEQYNNETYKLLNEAVFPILKDENRFPKKYIDALNFLEKPFPFLKMQPTRFNSLYHDFFNKKYVQVIPDSLLFKKWDLHKLPKITVVTEKTITDLYQLMHQYYLENDKWIEAERKTNKVKADSLYHLFEKNWNNKIGKSYTNLSHPYFNSEYSKALIYYDIEDHFPQCLPNPPLYFQKENNKWIEIKDFNN